MWHKSMPKLSATNLGFPKLFAVSDSGGNRRGRRHYVTKPIDINVTLIVGRRYGGAPASVAMVQSWAKLQKHKAWHSESTPDVEIGVAT